MNLILICITNNAIEQYGGMARQTCHPSVLFVFIPENYKVGGVTQLEYDYGELDNMQEQTLSITGLPYYATYTTYKDVAGQVTGTQLCSASECSTKDYITEEYTYNTDGQMTGLRHNTIEFGYDYDKMGRLSKRTSDNYSRTIQNETYVYQTINGYTTNRLLKIRDNTYINNNNRTATYDDNGYVTSVNYNNQTHAYQYDAFGRLTKETINGVATTYTYDEKNNIQKSGLTYTNGKLTSVNGQSIVYDNMGNPTTYKGNTFVWQQGRKLTSGTMNGNRFTYRYDGNGMRYKKVVGDAKTDYYYNGTQLLLEIRNGVRVYYIYGVTGIEGMLYRGQYYYFDKNTLGDIIAIRDSNRSVVARYTYDAWGNHTVYGKKGGVDRSKTSIGNVNPFRYRGYYYDTETGFYYLQTRYYDPTICRFINADNYELVAELSQTVGQLNLYAYANNNPIMLTDETGEGFFTALLIGVVVGAILGGIDGGITAVAAEQNFWLGFAAGAIGGAVAGAVTAILGPQGGALMSANAASLIGRGVSSTIYNFANEWFQTGTITTDNLGLYAADVVMDLTFSMLYINYFNNGISNNLVGMVLGGATDSFVDISQTFLYFSPTAQRRIHTGN